MSFRVWAGEGHAEFADVSVDDHATIAQAVRAMELGQHIKVFGPPERLEAYWDEWTRLEAEDDDVWECPGVNTWVVKYLRDIPNDGLEQMPYWAKPERVCV